MKRKIVISVAIAVLVLILDANIPHGGNPCPPTSPDMGCGMNYGYPLAFRFDGHYGFIEVSVVQKVLFLSGVVDFILFFIIILVIQSFFRKHNDKI